MRFVSGPDPAFVAKGTAQKYIFGDTCVYEYRNLKVNANSFADFYFYLPLYASIEWIKVGVPGINKLQETHPDVPILLAEHAAGLMPKGGKKRSMSVGLNF